MVEWWTQCDAEVQRGIAERNAAIPLAAQADFRVGINLGDVIVAEHEIFR